MSDFQRLADALRAKARNEITNQINGVLPQAFRVNPEDLSGDDGDDDDDEDDEDEEGDDDDVTSLCFEYPDSERNLASAAAAYRALGVETDVIAVYSDGRAYFGSIDDLKDYCEGNDLDPDEWDVYDDSEEIMSLDYDRSAMSRVLRLAEEHEGAYEEAKRQYEEFHWGDRSKTTTIKEIPGIEGPVVALGVARRIEYGSKKEGKWEEYYHLFGEESDTFPTLYAVGTPDANGHYRTLAIHGGNMHVEDRGVVD